MTIKFQGSTMVLSQPQTLAERVFMETVHEVIKQTGKITMEFNVSAMSANGNTTHVGLSPAIPDDFT